MANSTNSVFGAGATSHPLDDSTRIYAADVGTDGVGYVGRDAIQTGLIALNLSDLKRVYGLGAAYSLTTTPALVNLGTTPPQIVISKPGTYIIQADAMINYNAATFAANQDATLKLRRTNNTPADLQGATRVVETDIVTTKSGTLAQVSIFCVYTTANTDDAIDLFGDIAVLPSAGSLDVVSANIVAHLI